MNTLVSRSCLAIFGALMICCSSPDNGDAAQDPTGSPSGTLPLDGTLGGMLPSAGGAESARCATAGEVRSCCTTGSQMCKGGEFPEWGPCSVTCAGTPAPVPAATDGGAEAGDAAPKGGSSSGTSTTCTAGMVCKPGAIRYCDSSVAEWSKSTCGATGQWGPCIAATAPTGNGCSPDSYSPEKCCPPLKLCCQDNPGGPFVDFGSGACAAIACAP